MYYKSIVRFSCVLFLLLLERGVIRLAERDDIIYLKNALHQAQRDLKLAYGSLASARKSTNKARSSERTKDDKTRMSRDPKRRRKQLRAIDALHTAMRNLESIQKDYDDADFRFRAAKSEFDRYVLWFMGLLDRYYDNYSIETLRTDHTISAFFGGDNGDPYGENHGHYILDLWTWCYTCYRNVGEPHVWQNPIPLSYESSFSE